MPLLVPEQPLDTIAFITIRLHESGMISVAGHVADKRLCHQLLDHARDAIGRQVPDDNAIVMPNRDVDVQPNIPLKDWGDMAPHERGEP